MKIAAENSHFSARKGAAVPKRKSSAAKKQKPAEDEAPLSAAARKARMLKTLKCTDQFERAARKCGAKLVAGVDEVGRGALFGPVVAAAVVLPEATMRLRRSGLTDSKQLTRELREELDAMVRECALGIAIAEVDAATIDRINIYQASRLAMKLAVEALMVHVEADHLLVDALRLEVTCSQTKIIYGDALSLSIAAASVVAKVHRDALMRELDLVYPVYGLASHKGYGTPLHKKALKEFGPCELHRRSFGPVGGVEEL